MGKTDEPRPLTKRILQVPIYKEKYIAALKELFKNYFNEDYLYPILDSYKELLAPAVSTDTYFNKAFGFTYSDFLNSFTNSMNNHVKYGIKPYLTTRTSYALQQIPGVITETSFTEFVNSVYPNPSEKPALYYVSTTAQSTSPIVYNSLGNKIPITVHEANDTQTEITLPPHSPKGIYLIEISGKVFRWIYR